MRSLRRQEVSDDKGWTRDLSQRDDDWKRTYDTYMLCVSRRIVNEKQHAMPSAGDVDSGGLSVQLVSIAFWVLSNAMAPNFSQ